MHSENCIFFKMSMTKIDVNHSDLLQFQNQKDKNFAFSQILIFF